ncbi:MAG: YXWGXW repeat-containing protein, partial [Steroidobacteraceae bacterium]
MPLKTWSRSLLPTLILLALPALSMAQMSVNVSVNVPPPELPVYDQPPIPGDGYIWTPGYWAWDDDVQDYYWVPGTWVQAPQPEYLWTPGYWGWSGGAFLWNPGYWGPHVGFYGGVNYGYGYGGSGFQGGYWQGGHLYYNRSVTNVGTVNITNVYNKTVINNVTVNHVSYNGGTGGIRAQPTAAEAAIAHEHHIAAIPVQRQQEQTARTNPALRASANRGHPPIAATARPGAFSGAGVVAAQHAGNLSVAHAQPSREAQA